MIRRHGLFRIKAPFADLGAPPIGGSPADFGRIVADDTEKWARVIRSSAELIGSATGRS